ncbi:unnamed protein product [Pocillopora meandrina]|uniref:Uncharacterized protein n=1 Tax=Pocillopora meandrina TaxID=46732 RepID=A0AAU9XBW9_9CNID|nr:unnamed protein product [Pocillopora meandrina]
MIIGNRPKLREDLSHVGFKSPHDFLEKNTKHLKREQELSYSNKGYFGQKQSVHVRYVSVFKGQKGKFLSVYLALLEIPYAIELMKQTTASTLQMQHSLLLELDTVMDEEYT